MDCRFGTPKVVVVLVEERRHQAVTTQERPLCRQP
jgi:hypothetical protein